MVAAQLIAQVPPWLALLHWLCAAAIVAESLNKLERTAPLRRGLAARERVTECLKAIAWALLAMGGAGGVASPFLGLQPPTLDDVCVGVGFAVLIVRTRVKEG